MMQWWRCKHGAPFDTKWRTIARRVKGRPGDVWAVASALFDAASQSEPRGDIRQIDLEQIADGLGYDVDYVTSIFGELKDKAVHDGEMIVNFAKHQPGEDKTAADRKRRQRSKTPDRDQVSSQDGHGAAQSVTTSHAVTERDKEETANGHADDGRDAASVTTCHALDLDSELEKTRTDQIREGECAPAQDGDDLDIEVLDPIAKAGKPSVWQVGVEVPAEWKRDAESLFADLRIPVCDIALEAAKFGAYYGSRGEKRDNWHVSWINWLLKAKPISAERAAQLAAEKRSEVDAAPAPERALWGGRAGPVIDAVGLGIFQTWLSRAEFDMGPPAVLRVSKRLEQDYIRSNFRQKLEHILGVDELLIELIGQSPLPLISVPSTPPAAMEIPTFLRRVLPDKTVAA